MTATRNKVNKKTPRKHLPVAGEIRIENARTHNLQGVHCAFPIGQLTVVSGPSGSGKSSLAFDTLYAEGQRRYLSSLSSNARHFLERLPRPEVDSVSNLPPAIAVAQGNPVTNARSTVGSASEILDPLRLLFARLGETRCCGERVPPADLEALSARVAQRFAGKRVMIAAPGLQRKGESSSAFRERLLRDGHHRLLEQGGAVLDIAECSSSQWKRARSNARLLIDRIKVAPSVRTRLAEALASGFAQGDGVVEVVTEDGAVQRYHDTFACERCGRQHPTPTLALFSFDTPLGACAHCQGFGRQPTLDLEALAPDPARSLGGGAIQPFRTKMGRRHQRALIKACAAREVPTDIPWRELDAAQRNWVVAGDETWRGVQAFFKRLEARRYKVQARVMIARYRRFEHCAACCGTRLGPAARAVWLGERHLGELSRLSIGELSKWLDALELSATQQASARLIELLRARVATACEVGLEYLSLERPLRTLSGGEAQRIQLARALGGALCRALYVLDEPSVGLHPRDMSRLLGVLRGIRARGNTVVVVEHAPEIIAAADHLIDLGPGAGRHGGRVVAEGRVADVRACEAAATGRLLAGAIPLRRRRRPRARTKNAGAGALFVRRARSHNLQNLDVRVPLAQLVVVTGVSGAGKSSLVRSVLVGHLQADPERGACDGIEGADALRDVVVVERRPPARGLRSNAATVSKAFDGIRRCFASTPEARRQKLGPGWFSFNRAGGRCEECEGAGEKRVDMHFLEDLRVPCEHCGGARYREPACAIEWRDHSIVDVLQLSVDEARALFASERAVAPLLEPLARVGLGYLQLVQPLSTLSGGELQRVRIAQALASQPQDTLFVLDEPTTGLHASELQVLLDCLDQLLDAGASIVVVEHNLQLIAQADHIIDLGPEGGPGGGRLIATGTPAEVARVTASHTGAALRAARKRPSF